MDPSSYGDVNKNTPSAFYGALSGSVCFPMPLMYNPMNSYPFMSTPFLPMHHPMLSSHGLQDSHLLSSSDLLSSSQLSKSEDLSTRALAYLQSRYQSMGKCFLPPSRKSMSKYCVTPPSLMDIQSSNECTKLSSGGGYALQSSGDSNANGMTPSLTTVASPSSGIYPEKECYLSSPSTEVEEPDSSGKCSTDVVEQKVIPRWTCDSSQPPICPICGRTIALQDLTDHYHMELDRLNELMRKKEWLNPEENNAEQMDTLRLQSYHDVEKRCPEFRKETYLRVRANRINRLGGCGNRTKRQCFEETKHSWKIQRGNQLCSPKQENVADENSTQSGHQSMLMLELTDQNKTGELADSSCNGFNNLDVGSCQSSGYGDSSRRQRTESHSDENPCSSVDVKCLVCMESYKKPVVSVCCWHVHCETCWLKSLGNKRVCPQCDTITSPGDLRRIHL
ncbi:uncharacterized protein LOC118187533 isoform X2 [Stegodyphus dumicola]|uniref:uncharacterized protein LOC118187533 isoform X2 n=1 Tax=Stegodyphus dumicola TaxID=202533 RepID=UPI0015A98B0B|nr:uncharacterized protein LOC118187533 isoform X2 [Stegodyphus dumicola]